MVLPCISFPLKRCLVLPPSTYFPFSLFPLFVYPFLPLIVSPSARGLHYQLKGPTPRAKRVAAARGAGRARACRPLGLSLPASTL